MKACCFELCVETLEAARAAQAGGADRIELCAALSVGGVTADPDLIQATVKTIDIPVHVLIRARNGDFHFSTDEILAMRRQIEDAKNAGAAGVATGVLLANGMVDVERSRELVALAKPMKATFHRAFDEAPDLEEALEDVIATGADCLLTSGGAPDVLTGAGSIARLRELAAGRLDVMAGGGLRLHNLTEVVRRTGVSYLHGSLTRENGRSARTNSHNGHESSVLEEDVREAVRLFRGHFAAN